MDRDAVEAATGELYGQLWQPYDARMFEESLALFRRRLERVRFDPAWFQGAQCLDAGCGGGRNAIAMARLGAREVVGVDIGEEGLVDAQRRAAGTRNVRFEAASILDLPFKANAFDMVWCAGVLMHTADPERALDELARVTRPGGYLYLLVYATGGLRWPAIQLLRPLAAQLTKPRLEQAMEAAGLPANKRRTFLDDLFVPRLEFFHWERLQRALAARGFGPIDRWGPETRLDHEAGLAPYRQDLEALRAVFAAGAEEAGEGGRALFASGASVLGGAIEVVRWYEAQVDRKALSEAEAMDRVIGQGHHRVLARKA